MAHGHKTNEKVVFVGDTRVRKGKGTQIPPDYTAFPGKSEAFVPNFLLKEWMVGCVVLVGFLLWTISEPAPLGYPADPTNTSFIPMPDWYFLFLYQFLKYPYVSQDYILLGTLGIPGVLFGALLLAPFLDTGKERRFYRRPIASSLMGLTLVACIYLTAVSWEHYQDQLEINGIVPEHHERAERAREAAEAGQERPSYVKQPGATTASIVDANDPAAALAKQAGCINCHATDFKGQAGMPGLVGVGDRYSAEEIKGIIVNGKGNMPSQAEKFNEQELDQLVAWLAKQKKE